MTEKYLHILEYPKILVLLAEYTQFSASDALALALRPTLHYSEAITLQEETRQARQLLDVRNDAGIGGARDVRPLLEQAIRRFVIMPSDLLAIRQTLISARNLRRIIVSFGEDCHLLIDIAHRLEGCKGIIEKISQCISDAGEVKSSASSKLAQLRNDIEIAHGRILDKMNRLLASKTYSSFLQDSFITQREGRYVIPVKTDFKGQVKGVVHDQSSSGATIYVEPLSVVDLNNQWKQRQFEEQEEVRRILLDLADMIGENADFIASTVEALAELDLLFAKAKYAEAIEATSPTLHEWSHDGDDELQRIVLHAARHPLLDSETVVPIDVVLPNDMNMLIITGPNTGGKTISLKTIGLMALMAQSGLHIPVGDNSSLMVFDGIFADIGDEQSLEQNLSTFSGHMTTIIDILERCSEQSLVMFDELGAGTDPIEGAALARAILNRLLMRNITTLVATHYAELKAFAYTTEHVTNASMEFSQKTLAPTFRLRIGLPGQSNAFAIARRLGLPDNIVQTGEGLIDEDSKETERMLIKIKTELNTIRMQRLRVDEEVAEAEYYRKKMEERLSNIDNERRKILKTARRRAKRQIQSIRKKLAKLEADATASINEAKAAASKAALEKLEATKSAIADLEAHTKPPQEEKSPAAKEQIGIAKPVKIGDTVAIPHLHSKGIVTAIHRNDVEVQLGHFSTLLKRKQIHITEAEKPKLESESFHATEPIPIDGPGWELDLRGKKADDAVQKLEIYLDRAYLAGLTFVRIIHGKGTGVLRKAVREILKRHPLIISHKSGHANEGGDGVTVAKLAID